MCPAGVSVRRVEDITEVLRGRRASPSTISKRIGPEFLFEVNELIAFQDWRKNRKKAKTMMHQMATPKVRIPMSRRISEP